MIQLTSNITSTYQNTDGSIITSSDILCSKDIWKQDSEENIWAQEGWEWGMDKASQWGTS